MKRAIPFLMLAAGAVLLYAGIENVGPIKTVRSIFSTGTLPSKPHFEGGFGDNA